MARMNKQVLGSISGTIGDIVFRERSGGNYASLKPASYTTPEDPASINRRSKFRMAVDLARAINQNSQLKSLWKPDTPTGLSSFNFLVKTNYFHVSPESPGNFIILVPAGGFPFAAANINKSDAQMQVTVNALGTNTGIDPLVETKVQMLSVLFNSNPSGENTQPYSFITLSSNVIDISLTEQLIFTSPLNGSEGLLYNQYQDHTLYFVLITLNAESSIIHRSITLNG